MTGLRSRWIASSSTSSSSAKHVSGCYKECTPGIVQKHRLFDLFICFAYLMQKMVLHGEEGGCCSRRDADFAINMLNMMVDGGRGDREEGCHLAVGVSTGN